MNAQGEALMCARVCPIAEGKKEHVAPCLELILTICAQFTLMIVWPNS